MDCCVCLLLHCDVGLCLFLQSPNWGGKYFSVSDPSVDSCVCSPPRPPPPTAHRTSHRSITSRKEKEQKSRTPSPPAAPPSPLKPPCSPPAHRSLLSTLLARKRSIVTVPATTEVSPPLRGSSRPSPDRLPYLPHSPFHLFSYDLEEEASASAQTKRSTESASPRSAGQPGFEETSEHLPSHFSCFERFSSHLLPGCVTFSPPLFFTSFSPRVCRHFLFTCSVFTDLLSAHIPTPATPLRSVFLTSSPLESVLKCFLLLFFDLLQHLSFIFVQILFFRLITANICNPTCSNGFLLPQNLYRNSGYAGVKIISCCFHFSSKQSSNTDAINVRLGGKGL